MAQRKLNLDSLSPSIGTMGGRFRQYYVIAKDLSRVFYQPFYSFADVAGLARADDPTGHVLPAQEITLFAVSRGQQGQGFTRPLNYTETNLDGGNGQLPANYAFIGVTCGVVFHEKFPIIPMQDLVRHTHLAFVRSSLRWEMGWIGAWPSNEHTVQSLSAATTIANSEITFATNGGVNALEFPVGGELFFPPNQQIQFTFRTTVPIAITWDGEPANGGIYGTSPGGNQVDPEDGALMGVMMLGYKFESANL